MAKRIPYVILAVVLVGCGANSDDEIPIREVFQKYRTALLKGDGPAAWSVVDSDTREYYNKVAASLSSPVGGGFDRSDLVSRLTIMRMRSNFSRSELAKMDGRAIFIVGVSSGWISRSSVQRMARLTKVESDGESGKGYTSASSHAPTFLFAKESDGWKLALSKMFEPANEMLRAMARRSGMSVDEYLNAVLDQSPGRTGRRSSSSYRRRSPLSDVDEIDRINAENRRKMDEHQRRLLAPVRRQMRRPRY